MNHLSNLNIDFALVLLFSLSAFLVALSSRAFVIDFVPFKNIYALIQSHKDDLNTHTHTHIYLYIYIYIYIYTCMQSDSCMVLVAKKGLAWPALNSLRLVYINII